MEDMEEITFAGQKYYFTEELVKLWQKRLVLEIFKQNYSTEEEYSKFIFEYGGDVYTRSKFSGLTYDMVSNMIENGEDGLEKFYNENVEIEENKRNITFLYESLSIIIDNEVRKAFKEQTIAYFKKRFFPEIEEDFEFLSEFIPSILFYGLNERLSRLRELKCSKEEENIIQNEVVFYIKKLNILERFGVNEFKFAQLELDLQIKFLALMSIYKKPEQINSIINFFNSDLLTDEKLSNFIKIILDEFLEERANKDFVLKSKVVGQIGINQTTNEAMFDVIKDKLFLFNVNKRKFKFQLRNLKENFSKDEISNLSFENKDYLEKNSPMREVYIKCSPVEMINLILFVYDHSTDTLKTSKTYEKLKENVKKNGALTIEILSKQMVNTFENCMNLNQDKDIETLKKIIVEKKMNVEKYIYEKVNLEDREKHINALSKAFIIISEKIDYEYKIELMAKNLTEILLKGTESEKILQQKEQIILVNAQEIFYDVYNVKMEDEERKKYRKALAKAMDLAEAKIYTEYFINDFRKYTSKRWWQREKTAMEKFKIVNDEYINFVKVYGKDEIALNALNKAKVIVLFEVENKALNEKLDKFAMNNLQTSEEIFDKAKKLEEKINSSSQPENVKKSLLKKVNDIGQEKFKNISPQQINSDFKFLTRP